MGKFALCLAAALLVVSAPALAKTKKAKPVQVASAAQPMSQNEASLRLLRESLPLFLPSAGQVIYFSTHKDDDAKADAPKKVAHRVRH
jgi:hypothetical protein